jgi:hypothetical protein
MDSLGFERPVRAVAAAGGYPEGVESRTVKFEDGFLTYLHNETGKEAAVKLDAPGRQFAEIFCVNTEQKLASPAMTLAPYETRIMRIKLR